MITSFGFQVELSKNLEAARMVIIGELDALGMEARALGRTDYPSDFPLREVLVIVRHCSGGVILGFKQIIATEGIVKPDTKEQADIKNQLSFPTPWNNLEAGILFALGRLLLVFREDDVSGGVLTRV